MRLVPLFATASLSLLSASGQTVPTTAAAAQQTTSIVALQSNGQGCPVGFQARRSPDGGLVSVAHSPKHHQQSYQLSFSPGPGHFIAQARITFHGLAGGRVIPAGYTTPGDATESFNISPSPDARHLFQSTIYTEKLTGVQWVELNELTYADGTKWQETGTASCRVAPNGFMLVAGTR